VDRLLVSASSSSAVFIAAPTAGRLLADFGAEVVKVERPGTGDELRRWRLHGGDTSLLFRTLNRNKRSIASSASATSTRRSAASGVARSRRATSPPTTSSTCCTTPASTSTAWFEVRDQLHTLLGRRLDSALAAAKATLAKLRPL
jgi:hypothetical protein